MLHFCLQLHILPFVNHWSRTKITDCCADENIFGLQLSEIGTTYKVVAFYANCSCFRHCNTTTDVKHHTLNPRRQLLSSTQHMTARLSYFAAQAKEETAPLRAQLFGTWQNWCDVIEVMLIFMTKPSYFRILSHKVPAKTYAKEPNSANL